MRKFLWSIVALMAIAVGMILPAAPAAAITGNWVEDNEHPFVGLIAFYDANGEFTHRCSGSLLTSTVFLTAGHCTDATTGATHAVIWFQQDAGADYNPTTGAPATSGYPDGCAAGTLGTLCATSDRLYNYGFADFAGYPDTRDVGIVILDQPITLSEYGALAGPGFLDGLATQRGIQDVLFTASGYGLSYSSPVTTTSYRERLMGQAILTNLRSANTAGFNLQTSGNGKGRGGTCSGDSGGPVFYGSYSSNTIVAVTSFGLNSYCRGADFAYRLDRAAVLAWIRSVVGATEFAKIEIVQP